MRYLFAVLFFLLSSCSDPTKPTEVTIEGKWEGSYVDTMVITAYEHDTTFTTFSVCHELANGLESGFVYKKYFNTLSGSTKTDSFWTKGIYTQSALGVSIEYKKYRHGDSLLSTVIFEENYDYLVDSLTAPIMTMQRVQGFSYFPAIK